MTLLDVVVAVIIVFVILYCAYGYFKEAAELPKYRPHLPKSDERAAEVAKIRA